MLTKGFTGKFGRRYIPLDLVETGVDELVAEDAANDEAVVEEDDEVEVAADATVTGGGGASGIGAFF